MGRPRRGESYARRHSALRRREPLEPVVYPPGSHSDERDEYQVHVTFTVRALNADAAYDLALDVLAGLDTAEGRAGTDLAITRVDTPDRSAVPA